MLPPHCRCARRERSEGRGLPRRRPRPPPPPALRQALRSETDPLLLPNQPFRGRGEVVEVLAAKALLLAAAALATMLAQAAEEWRMVAEVPVRAAVAANQGEERSGLSR